MLKINTRLLKVVFSTVLLLMTSFAFSQQAQGDLPWEKKPFKGLPSDILKAAENIQMEDAEQVQVLLKEEIITLKANGLFERSYHWVYKILDQNGVSEWSSTSGSWSPWHQNKPVIRVRVINADGKQNKLNEAQLVESAADSYSDKIYSDRKLLSGPMPNVLVGSVIEEDVTVTDIKPFFEAGEAEMIRFDTSFPVYSRRIIFIIEDGAQFTWKTYNMEKYKPVVTNKDGKTTYVFSASELKPSKDAQEKGLSPFIVNGAWISISTGKNWETVAAKYLEKVSAVIGKPDFKSEVKGLIVQENEKSTIQSVVRWMNEKVRYTGMELGENSLIPAPPVEVLSRGYGDCKEKSVLLAELLKSIGIDAYPALVRADWRSDIDTQMPGLGVFNHCIVYVETKTGPVWIDPTSDFLQPGELGGSEQNRQALIIRNGTKTLTPTVSSNMEDNYYHETTDYYLSNYGYSDIKTEYKTGGNFESYLRQVYAGYSDKKELKEILQKRVDSDFRFGKLGDFTYTDPYDITTPFTLNISATQTGRAMTDFLSADSAVMINESVNQIDDYFLEKEENDTEEPRKNPYYVSSPLTYKWVHKFHLPAGFVNNTLPDDEEILLGAASISKHFYTEDLNVVVCEVVFKSGKQLLTAVEALEQREKISHFYKNTQAIILSFYHEGETLFENGKYRESMDLFKKAAEQENSNAINYVRLAYAYLRANMGRDAREQINKAVKIDPASAFAWYYRGIIYQYDENGLFHQPGYERDIVVASWEKALELDSENSTYKSRLAGALAYDESGLIFADKKNSSEAADLYIELSKSKDKKDDEDYTDLILTSLNSADRYSDLLSFSSKISNRNLKSVYNSYSICMTEGYDKMIQSLSGITSVTDRKKVMEGIAGLLVKKEKYQECAKLWKELGKNSSDALNTESKADLYRKLGTNKESVDYSKPEKLFVGMLNSIILANGRNFESTKKYVTDDFYQKYTTKENLNSNDHFSSVFNTLKNSALSLESGFNVTLDLLTGASSGYVEGSDETGYKVRISSYGFNGSGQIEYYVVKESDGYKIAAYNYDVDLLGVYMKAMLDSGKTDLVKQWLGWLKTTYSAVYKGSELLTGMPFLLLIDGTAIDDVSKMNAAVSSILCMNSKSAGKGSEYLLQNLATATGKEKTAYQWALYLAAFQLNDGENALKYSSEIYKTLPESEPALGFYAYSLLLCNKYDEFNNLISPLYKAQPDNAVYSKLMRLYLTIRNDFPGLKDFVKDRERKSLSDAIDYNSLCWTALFNEGGITEEILEMSRKSVKDTKNGEAGIIHTLACLYAAQGRCKEASDLYEKLMELSSSRILTENEWLVLGMIAEAYGLTEIADKSFENITMPESLLDRHQSCYELKERIVKSRKTVL